MTTSIYVASVEGQAGKSLLAAGLLDALHREFVTVGMFRPIYQPGKPDVIESLLAQPGMDQTFADAAGVTYDDIHADAEAALATLVAKYAQIKEKYEAVVVLGSDYADDSLANEFAYNTQIAANLNTPVMLVASGKGRTPAAVLQTATSAISQFEAKHVRVVSVVANRVDAVQIAAFRDELCKLTGVVTAVLPADRLLAAPNVADQFDLVDAKLLQGDPALLERESASVLVGAMTLPNILERLEPESTVLLPSDRSELLPGVLLAHASGTFPQLSSVLLIGGYPIPVSIRRLIAGIASNLPVGVTQLGTYTVAEKLFRFEGAMTSSPRKVEIARRLFSENVDFDALLAVLQVERPDVVTPLMFEHQMMEMARSDRRTIVLPEASDDRILYSADILLRRGVANLILLGNPIDVKARANAIGVSLEGAQIVDPTDADLVERFAGEYARLRAHKGVSIAQAKEKMADLSYFGTMMVHLGMADGMVSGACHTTANTIRPSLEFIKTVPGVSVVSGAFLMCLEDRVLVYADCAVNPNPSATQLADVALASAQTAAKFGITPRVAMLSYSTGDSGSGVDVDKVREATQIARQKAPDLALEGPIQFDAAVDPVVAQTKLPQSSVAGRATVFIFPDLNTGNNTYKAVQRSAGAVAVGPVLQGLNKPVNDLSRGALVEDIVNTVAITAIQAQAR